MQLHIVVRIFDAPRNDDQIYDPHHLTDLIRLRQAQHLLGNKTENELRADRGDARDQGFPQIALDMKFLGVAEAAMGHHGLPCGPAANAAKYLAAEAGFHACEQAVMTHGGFGYAKEFHVERYLRESLIPRIAPISPQLTLSFIAEKVLGLPKSY